MDERTKELIAIGASAAVNCRPCLEYHLAACRRLGLAGATLKDATEVGLMVGRGAMGKTRGYIAELLDERYRIDDTETADASGCGCSA